MRPRRPFGSPWVESNARHLRKPPGAALDLACGRGRHSLLLLDLGYEVVAVDSDAAALAALEQRAPEAAKGRLRVVEHDLEAAVQHGQPWPSEVSGRKFAAVLVVNYLHRPLLPHLLDLLAPGGVLIYEAWASGNEAYAAPKDAKVLTERMLRPNELLELAFPRCEVLGFSHGPLEDYEGRDCAKQMLCARLPPPAAAGAEKPDGAAVDAAKAPGSVAADAAAGGAGGVVGGAFPDGKASVALAALLEGRGGAFLGEPAFGTAWLHARGAAPALPFGVEELLSLLQDYDPAPAREAHLARMRRLAAGEGATLEDVGAEDTQAMLRLWGASMVRRLPPTGKETVAKDGLRTDAVDDDAKIRAFLAGAQLSRAEDLAARGESWTFVVNQLQGAAPCLRDLQHGLFCRTGLSGGLNGYLTPPGEIGKPPHIDDHDVLVVQQAGEKVWLLLDTVTRQTAAEVHLRQGDVLYLPQGLPHHARAAPGAPSMHIAVGLHRSPLSIASLLAALLTVRALGGTPGSLSTAVVEEMDSRAAAFAAYGGREHWLNQLLPAHLHLQLVGALDPEDRDEQAPALKGLAAELAMCARRLLDLLQGGPCAVPGDTPGAARHRAMQQAAAMGSEAELKAAAGLPESELTPLAAEAFWARREHSMDQHFAHHGPRRATPGAVASADELQAGSLAPETAWRRPAGQVAALLRPRGVLRANGYRLPGLSVEELEVARHCLRVHSGAACRPFTLADLPGAEAAKRSIIGKLLCVGALERLPGGAAAAA